MQEKTNENTKQEVAELEKLEKARDKYREYLRQLDDLPYPVVEKPEPQYGPPSAEHPLSDNRSPVKL